jgi:hypothetical protein
MIEALLTDKEVDAFADYEPHPLADTTGPAHLLFMTLKRACSEVRNRRAPQAETGWLLEIQNEGRAWWWRGSPTYGLRAWTSDPNDVVRFARKVDAERARDAMYEVCEHVDEYLHRAIATDHMWCPPLPEET